MAAEFQKYTFNYVTDFGGTVTIPTRIKNGSPYVPPGYQPRATNALPCGSSFNFRPRRLIAKRLDGQGKPEQYSYVVNRDQVRSVTLALVQQGFQCVDLEGESWPNAVLELSN
jgi:hypothetical protein